MGHVERVCKAKNPKPRQNQKLKLQKKNMSGIKRSGANVAIFLRVAVKCVKIGNGDCIVAGGKRAMLVNILTVIKTISDVLYVPNIHQNLFSVGQLLEKDYSIVFKHNACEITDVDGCKLLPVEMKNKSFLAELSKAGLNAFSSILDEYVLWHNRSEEEQAGSEVYCWDIGRLQPCYKKGKEELEIDDDEMIDCTHVRGTRSLADIYQRCNLAVLELQAMMKLQSIQGLSKSLNEPTLYVLSTNDNLVYVSLYVDDVLVIGIDVELIKDFKKEDDDAI
ncbi:uncharacterized protein LOC127791036 [Diospyros lotus]|uniref:uncharacterized protein LOC127791036 n=1 Tax=Diospyros lotus TaxID=55363 RepID=UPI00225A1DCD|nr:uncharacterized protein LOC127791036 [Diospyros lotus]